MTDKTTKLPSNKSFGLLFAVVFALAAYFFSNTIAFWPLVVLAVLALVLALTAPHVLKPFNKAWMLFGVLLGKIISPIVLALLFFCLIAPVAFAARLLGRDELRLKKIDVQSYWKLRDPPGPDAASFKNQF